MPLNALKALTIKARLYAGFGILVAISLGLVVFSVSRFSAIHANVLTMNVRAENSMRVLEADADLEKMGRNILRYTDDRDELLLKENEAVAASAVRALEAAAKSTLTDERRRLYLSLVTGIGEIQKKTAVLVEIVKGLAVDQAKLRQAENELAAGTVELVEAVQAGGNQDLIAIAARAESALLSVHVINLRTQANQDANGVALLKAAVGKASGDIAALERGDSSQNIRARAGALETSLRRYAAMSEAVVGNLIKVGDLYRREIAPSILQLQKTAAGAKAQLRGAFGDTRVSIEHAIAGTVRMQEVIGALALLLGALVAYFIARGIVRPVTGMTDAMETLAGGRLDITVPGLGRGDEIGAMAKAVEVFKINALDNRRLLAEQKDAELRAADERRSAEERELAARKAADEKISAERKAAMHKLADDFDKAVGDIIRSVSSASAELEAAANTLTKNAETTRQLSTVVASASEQASTNVQSVASAAEQMTGSVGEISRQVQQSSNIAAEAVRQAEKTDARINSLSNAAQRIGEVVKLITSVAAQTNLLALNATIEAARAGDAGRGFAIVAQEVKALAAQTGEATEEISSQIAAMQSETAESVTAIKEISGTIGRISEIAATIAAAVEQQGAATQEISRNVQEAAQGTAQVATNIATVDRGAGETGSASSQVLSSAQSLSNGSDHLKVEVQKFLETVRAA